MQPMVFSPSADVVVVWPLRNVQFSPPDDGPVRPETCRGKRLADIVRRRKNSVSSWK